MLVVIRKLEVATTHETDAQGVEETGPNRYCVCH
jgi:hypothetical protein